MTSTAKVLITLAVSFVVIAGATAGVAVLLFVRYGDELGRASRKSIEQGEAFGRQTDEAGCLQEAIARYKADRGFTGSVSVGMFEQGCFRESRPSAGFCDGVPSPLNILRSGQWQIDQARRAGIRDQFGGQVFGQVQAWCDLRARMHRDGPAGAEDKPKPAGG